MSSGGGWVDKMREVFGTAIGHVTRLIVLYGVVYIVMRSRVVHRSCYNVCPASITKEFIVM